MSRRRRDGDLPTCGSDLISKSISEVKDKPSVVRKGKEWGAGGGGDFFAIDFFHDKLSLLEAHITTDSDISAVVSTCAGAWLVNGFSVGSFFSELCGVWRLLM
jgi:hypothetical protein